MTTTQNTALDDLARAINAAGGMYTDSAPIDLLDHGAETDGMAYALPSGRRVTWQRVGDHWRLADADDGSPVIDSDAVGHAHVTD